MSKATQAPKESRKRKAPLAPSNQLTNYFSNPHAEPKVIKEAAVNLEASPASSSTLKRLKRNKTHDDSNNPTPTKTETNAKITIFLKKDQSGISVSSQTTEDTAPSEGRGLKMLNKSQSLSLKKINSQGTLKFTKEVVEEEIVPKVPKKTMVEFYRKVEEAYGQEEFPILKELISRMTETLRKKSNPKKVERFFNTHMKQFLRSSPDQLWSKVYRPNSPSELLSDKYANMMKFWLRKFFKDQKYKGTEAKENSRSMSQFDEESNGASYFDFEKEFREMKIAPEDQETLKNMRYRSLLVVSKEGRGKLSMLESVCTELNLEPIEVCNSSNRSSCYLDQIYEATQSQNVQMSVDIKQTTVQVSDGIFSSKEDSMHITTSNAKANVIIVLDFDKPLDIDKGFQNKIVKLSETSKSPFILLCEKVPKKLKKPQTFGVQGPSTQIDQLHLEKCSIEDVALLFYMLLTIEKNFSNVMKDFRYKVQAQSPNFPDNFKEDLKTIFSSIDPNQLEILTCYDDILEVVKFFEGNLTTLISKFEFYKDLIYEKRLDELKKECFLASESYYRKKHDIFVRFEKDQFSKQLIDSYKGTHRKNSLRFHCPLDHLNGINKLSKALDFFSEPEKEEAFNMRDLAMKVEPNDESDTLLKMSDFFDRMGTLDILETKILSNKMELDWDNINHLYKEIEQTKQQPITGGHSVDVINLKNNNTWNQFELEEKIFNEVQKESLLHSEYLVNIMQDSLQNKCFVDMSPYDEDWIMKMLLKLKKELCKMFSENWSHNYKSIEDVNEYIVLAGNTENTDYKPENLKGRLRNSRLNDNKEARVRIESNIYIKSVLSQELKQIREIRFNGRGNKEANLNGIFGPSNKDGDIDELIKTFMTFSRGFYNKKEFSDYHSKVLQQDNE